MDILKIRNRPKCQHCNKAKTYNKILGKWECRNCLCLIARLSGELASSIHSPIVGIVAGATFPTTYVDILGVSAKTAKKLAKTVKSSAKVMKTLKNKMP